MKKNKAEFNRRQFIGGAASASALAITGFPAIGQAKVKLKVGYVDTLAVTGQLWTGVHRGQWAKEGIEFDPYKFNTGLDLFNAMLLPNFGFVKIKGLKIGPT